MSTAVLGVTGTASAATTTSSFTTASGMTQLEITADPMAQCTVTFQLDGARGGAGIDANGSTPGAPGGRVTGTSSAIDGDVFDLFAGAVGEDGVNGTEGAGGAHAGALDGLSGYTDGATIWGGGGGGASSVARAGDSPILAAFGGKGGLADNGAGAGGNYDDNTLHADGVAGTASNTGAGVISGTVTCVTKDPIAPGTPTLRSVQAGDGTATFQFTPGSLPQNGYDSVLPVTYEYSVDKVTWKPFTVGFTGSDDLTGTATGLTNMKTYSLSVRATSTAGNSAASAPMTVTPFRPVAAPAGVTAKVGVSSITISWTPPTQAEGIVDYLAFATPEGAQSSQDTVFCETAATSCTIAVKAGRAYNVGVVSRDALGGDGGRAFAETTTGIVPASAIPSTLPQADGPLTSSETDGTAVAGAEITMSGTGFLPGSTVELVVYSTPVKLGEAVVSADGSFSATVTLPEDLASGDHHLVATGVDPDGNVRNLVVEISVTGGAAALADTGFSAAPVLGAGALALLAGGGLMVAARRRQAA